MQILTCYSKYMCKTSAGAGRKCFRLKSNHLAIFIDRLDLVVSWTSFSSPISWKVRFSRSNMLPFSELSYKRYFNWSSIVVTLLFCNLLCDWTPTTSGFQVLAARIQGSEVWRSPTTPENKEEFVSPHWSEQDKMPIMTEYNSRPEDVGEILVKVSLCCHCQCHCLCQDSTNDVIYSR